jgi:hypothetical protein
MMDTAPALDGASPTQLARRTLKALGVVAACYVALIATHGGEFWPFSVYPMFASAGKPWQRALVRVMDGAPLTSATAYTLDALPGTALPLREHGVPQNDLSSLVQRAERWSDAEVATLGAMFGGLPCRAPLVVLRVRGSLEAGVLRELATPVARIGCDAGRPRATRLSPGAP